MKQHNDCSAVGSALHFRGCPVLAKLFHAFTVRRFLQTQMNSIAIYWQLFYHGLLLKHTKSCLVHLGMVPSLKGTASAFLIELCIAVKNWHKSVFSSTSWMKNAYQSSLVVGSFRTVFYLTGRLWQEFLIYLEQYKSDYLL